MKQQALALKKKSEKKIQKPSSCTAICPVRDILNYIGDKWSMLIILQLGTTSPLRFGELKDTIGGISQKMLTITLRQLEKDGFIEREYFNEVPPRVEYSITPLGLSLLGALQGLVQWAANNQENIIKARKKAAA